MLRGDVYDCACVPYTTGLVSIFLFDIYLSEKNNILGRFLKYNFLISCLLLTNSRNAFIPQTPCRCIS